MSDSPESTSKNKSDKLAAFEEFGQRFLAQFAPIPQSTQNHSTTEKKNRKNKRKASEQLENPTGKKRRISPVSSLEYTREDEEGSDGGDLEDMDSGESIDNENDGRDEEEEDHDFSSPAVPVVVYGTEQRREKIVQSSDRRFMSSKISKIRSNQLAASSGMTKKEKEDEMESMANDRSLYKLLHTRLLTTSLDDPLALDLKGSKKKKSLEGRVLEVANAAKLGKGETTVRKQEHAKVPRKIREGMEKRRKELKQMKLQEAKDVGNYHPTIKKLLADDSDRPKRNAKRERGLRMGVGTFKGGTLTLGKQDIQKARGHELAHRHSKNRKRG